MKRQVPRMTTDAAAEAFLELDLSDLDYAQFKPVRFQFPNKPKRPGNTIRKPASAASRPPASRLAPGTPAPRSGIYQQTGPRGGRPGEIVPSAGGKPLPPAPKGRTWTLIDPSPQKRHK